LGAVPVRSARAIVLHEADEIARAGQTEPDDAGVRAAIDDVVDAARLEAAVEGDGTRRCAVNEAPARSRNQLTLCNRVVTHGHDVLGAVGIDWRVRFVIAIGDRRSLRALVRDEIAAHQARDAPPVPGHAPAGVGTTLRVSKGCDRHLHAHRARPFRHVPLPSHPEEREALPHQRAVAELGVACRVGGSGGLLKRREHRLAPAVADLVEQPAVAAARVDRFQHVEVGGRLHLATRIPRPERQIDDGAIAWKTRIEAEVDLADEFFVRAGGAERAAVEDDFAPLDAQTGDARFGDRGDERQHQRRDEDSTHSAPLKVTPRLYSGFTHSPQSPKTLQRERGKRGYSIG